MIERCARSYRLARPGGRRGSRLRIQGKHQENTKRIRSKYEANTKTPPELPARRCLADGLKVALRAGITPEPGFYPCTYWVWALSLLNIYGKSINQITNRRITRGNRWPDKETGC